MATNKPRPLIAIEYAEAAQAYLRNLPPEHFMESVSQATQRKVTLESMDLVHARRPEVQVFNELLVQYPHGRQKRPAQVVPDNMVVIWKTPIKAEGSFDIPLQPVGPFWVMEYVSRNNKRKDYEESFRKYERDLKVHYYLLYYLDDQELSLFHHNGREYVSVKPNEAGRHEIPELDVEVGLVDGWVRYWYKGDLLPLPADLQHEIDVLRAQLARERQRADQQQQRADQQQQRADQQQQRADQQQQRADLEQKRADEERKHAELAMQQAAQLRQRAEEEKTARVAVERELEALRAQLRQR